MDKTEASVWHYAMAMLGTIFILHPAYLRAIKQQLLSVLHACVCVSVFVCVRAWASVLCASLGF